MSRHNELENVAKYLKQFKKRQTEQKLLYGKEYDKSGYVCCWKDGRTVDTAYLSHKFFEINELATIKFHDLRHSTAFYLLKIGVSIKEFLEDF